MSLDKKAFQKGHKYVNVFGTYTTSMRQKALDFQLKKLPPPKEKVETIKNLKQVSIASTALGELTRKQKA